LTASASRSSIRNAAYDDQREVHRQIFEGDETIDYAFMGQDPNAADNQWLRETFENQIPIIYFLGVSPGRYQPLQPTFISGWDSKALKANVALGAPDQVTLGPPETARERRYALRAVKQRLHQASFREAVITAYNGRCALSGLPEPLLLDAAHIIAGKDEPLGQPVVPNGIHLSKIHQKRRNRAAIHMPGRVKDRPDRDRLALRFDRFKGAA
jgi:putative restriction endonuclease